MTWMTRVSVTECGMYSGIAGFLAPAIVELSPSRCHHNHFLGLGPQYGRLSGVASRDDNEPGAVKEFRNALAVVLQA